jgi:hypothetical protein
MPFVLRSVCNSQLWLIYIYIYTACMVYWSQFLVADPEVTGSVLDITRFSE